MHSDLALLLSIGNDRTILECGKHFTLCINHRHQGPEWLSVYSQGVTGRQISLNGKTWGILCLGICIQLVWSLLWSIIHSWPQSWVLPSVQEDVMGRNFEDRN